MAEGQTKLKRVLFVDDEPAFLEMIGQAFSYWGRGQWEIHQATEVAQALRILQEASIDLAVVDIRMPTVDGVQLLRLLRRKYPNLMKAVLTGYATEEYRAACLAEGAELFLEKPRGPDGLHSLYAALTELVKWQPEQGFRGVLRRVGLEDVLQMECLGRNSSVLEVTGQAVRGQIFVQEGQIIHAQIADHQGDDAFHEILTLRGGEFQLKPFQEPAQTTIQAQWEFLLMESARRRDEAAHEAASGQTAHEANPGIGLTMDLTAELASLASPAKISDEGVDATELAPAQNRAAEPFHEAIPRPCRRPSIRKIGRNATCCPRTSMRWWWLRRRVR